MYQITKLTNVEIQKFIINPLPPPIQFTDRNYNGDFGLLPTEIWDKIYDIKKDLEEKQVQDDINEIKNLKIQEYERCYHMYDYSFYEGSVEPSFKMIKSYYNEDKDSMENFIVRSGYFEDYNFDRLFRILKLKRPRQLDKTYIQNAFSEAICEMHWDIHLYRNSKDYVNMYNIIQRMKEYLICNKENSTGYKYTNFMSFNDIVLEKIELIKKKIPYNLYRNSMGYKLF